MKTPPYAAGERARARRVLDLEADTTRDITLVTGLRWRSRSSGAVSPQLSVGLLSDAGESTLLQIFESGGALRTRADLEMTDALEIGVWYSVMLTIGGGPERPVQVRVFDQGGAEVWSSCGGGAGRCPSAQLDLHDLDSLRLRVAVDDVRDGAGHVQLEDTSLLRDP